jgi:hypothetical protein
MVNRHISQSRIIVHIKVMISLYLYAYIKSFRGPIILTVSLMICKRYFPPIHVIESKGLSGFFFL